LQVGRPQVDGQLQQQHAVVSAGINPAAATPASKTHRVIFAPPLDAKLGSLRRLHKLGCQVDIFVLSEKLSRRDQSIFLLRRYV
jgi:hypothetical protein